MSIDIKTLRIGSHILVGGKRERVRGLDEDNGLIIRFPAEYVMANEVEPIKIAPEILTEIGFMWRETAGSWCRYQNYDGENYGWGIYICYSEERGCMISLYLKDYRLRPQLYAKYLHELEGQLACYGVELIPD